MLSSYKFIKRTGIEIENNGFTIERFSVKKSNSSELLTFLRYSYLDDYNYSRYNTKLRKYDSILTEESALLEKAYKIWLKNRNKRKLVVAKKRIKTKKSTNKRK